MEANPRLQRRIIEAIGDAHGTPISGAPRLDGAASRVSRAIADDRTGFTRLCGLAQIGRRLAMATNPEDYNALVRAFGAEPLAAAVRIAASLPEGSDAHGYDSQQLVPAVDRMGAAVLREWITLQPHAAQTWLTMTLPRVRSEDTTTIGSQRSTAIVEAAVDAWPLRTPERTGEPRRIARRAA